MALVARPAANGLTYQQSNAGNALRVRFTCLATPVLTRFSNFSPMPFVNGIKAAPRAPTMSEPEFLGNEGAGCPRSEPHPF